MTYCNYECLYADCHSPILTALTRLWDKLMRAGLPLEQKLALTSRESKGWYRFQLFQKNFVMLTIFYYLKPKNKVLMFLKFDNVRVFFLFDYLLKKSFIILRHLTIDKLIRQTDLWQVTFAAKICFVMK